MYDLDLPTFFRQVLDPSGLQVWIRDIDGRYRYGSTAWQSDWGIDPHNIDGKTHRELFGEDPPKEFDLTDARVLRTGSPVTKYFDHIHDGRRVERLVQKFPVRDSAGKIVAIAGIARDLSPQNRLQRNLWERLNQIEGIYNATQQGISRLQVVRDDGGNIVDFLVIDANPAAYRLAGLGPEQLVGKRLSELVTDPESVTAFVEGYRLSREMGRMVAFVRERPGPNGPAVLSINLKAIDGHAVVTTNDISQERANQQRLNDTILELQRERRKYQTLYRHAPVMLQSLDTDRRIVEVSDRWLEVLGYRRDEVIGEFPTKFLTEEADRRAVEDYVPVFWKQGFINDAPIDFRTRSGKVIETEISSIADDSEDGSRTMSVIVDVTERNRARDALNLRNRQLEASYERLNQFTANASHDLVEPLRKIVIYTEILAAALDADDRAEVDRAMKVISATARRGRDLVTNLLAFSHASDAGTRRKTVSLRQAVAAAIEDQAELADRNGTEVLMEVGDETVSADPTQLGQLINNLLANAVVYSRNRDPGRVVLSSAKDGGALVLSVADNGIGIAAEDQATIFEPFRRLHSRDEFPGTGLGLAICKMICERHGWDFTLESAPGEGSTFSIRMPIEPPA